MSCGLIICIVLYLHILADTNDLPKTYYIDITVNNNWKNQIAVIWLIDSTLQHMLVPSENTKRKLLVVSGDHRPRPLLFKFADTESEKDITVHGKFQTFIYYSEMLQPIAIDIDRTGRMR